MRTDTIICNVSNFYIASSIVNTHLDEKYGRIPAEKHQKPLENGSSIRFGKFSNFFWCHPTNFLFCLTEIDHKASKKFQKISKLNTTSMLQRFSVFSSTIIWCFPHLLRQFRWNLIIFRDCNRWPGQLSGYSTAVWPIRNSANAPWSPLRDATSPAGDVTSLICFWEARNN
jgi:hypothetical protein